MKKIFSIKKTIINLIAIFGALFFTSCNQNQNTESNRENEEDEISLSNLKDGEAISNVGVLELAAQKSNLQSFTTAAAQVNLQEILDEADGQFTIFAPSDEAFEKAGIVFTKGNTTNNEELKEILLQHVIPQHTTSEYWYEEIMYTTLDAGRVVIHLKDSTLYVNNSKFLNVDIEGNGGVLHIIDEVMEPYPQEEDVDTGQ